ncbi:hypothetical protein [Dyadobacter sp. NIV53]|uniref:hypothetical protein n=1 Tax=Dyadobacter sp. NIV53 TaxID=2861765 RepID=UPI001C883B26|nr:hypothetical protein [Dyadobacter sp. NIV53]
MSSFTGSGSVGLLTYIYRFIFKDIKDTWVLVSKLSVQIYFRHIYLTPPGIPRFVNLNFSIKIICN